MLPRAPRAVIFDMDGLLVDTEVLCRDAMMHQARAMGREMPLGVFLTMVGTHRVQSELILREHFGPDFHLADFHTGWVAHFTAVAEAGVRLKVGVVELLDLLDEIEAPKAVCTSSPHREVKRNLEQHDLLQRFDVVVARGDYTRGKPHPEPFLTAAAALGVAPELCLALEDSHYGVRAAHAAGMMTIMVPDLLEPTDEIEGLCVRIAETLHEVRDLIAAAARTEEQA